MAIKDNALKHIVRTPLFKMRVEKDKTKPVRSNIGYDDALDEYEEYLEMMNEIEDVDTDVFDMIKGYIKNIWKNKGSVAQLVRALS